MGYSRNGYIWTPTRRDVLRTAGGVLAAGLLAPRIARAATFSLLSHVGGSCGSTSPQTTATLNTTGADLLILGLAYDGAATFDLWASLWTDSQGNTWVPLTVQTSPKAQIWYCKPSSVGSGHTVTIVSDNSGGIYLAAYFAAFSGSASSAFDLQNGAANTATSPGSITPSVDNALVISVVSSGSATPTVDAAMTVLDNNAVAGGRSWGGGMAYKIQTTVAAINPVWTGSAACVIASFKSTSSSGGGGSTPVRRRVIGGE